MDDSIIKLRSIAKVYRVGVETIHALRGVDLSIGRNEMVAIMASPAPARARS
jgi:putative ABC transport system ATP-binding protein